MNAFTLLKEDHQKVGAIVEEEGELFSRTHRALAEGNESLGAKKKGEKQPSPVK